MQGKKSIVAVVLILGALGIIFLIANSKNMSQKTQTNLKTITIDEIAKHGSASDCWTAIDGGVYNITDFISNHPGGNIIVRACGTDSSSLFNGQGHSGAARSMLSKYQIGALAK